jgi:hypothetical protein
MKSIKTNVSLVGTRNEPEAMVIICNIQMMQDKIHGEHFEYFRFNGNTVEELRELQYSLIPEYNNALKA